ncbi:hypothetical protein HF086_002413 [Spodoptera exigua]|uniref:Activating signal cointegrator 1 n=1 Tax=Spodoptera exigua TaxID=7107 RepID=A0A922SGA7_SPOEX|nr:hypothetical protein HF086_002413 [Spodoptera exigua]
MEQWISEGLSKILDFQIPDDLIKYIMSIESENDLNEYMKTLLDFDNSQHKGFFLELCKKKFPSRASSQPKQQKKKISKNKQQDFISAPPVQEIKEPVETDGKSKKKTKYICYELLWSCFAGRHRCDCQASKHDLVNNCIQCGRVVCTQEGSGPCLFCGNLVCTPEEQKELNSKTKGAAKLMESLMERSRPKGWEAALSHRNRLLEYDRTSERRTRVTDDDSDYFNANSVWLNATEKEKLEKYQQSLHEKKHGSRLNKKMTFDFAETEVTFPSFYPTGCLLGCVNVDDCLPQEEYQKKYPGGESDSPYVFICSNPISLRLRFPIKGAHKIYALDKTIHQAAVKCIQKMSKVQANAA